MNIISKKREWRRTNKARYDTEIAKSNEKITSLKGRNFDKEIEIETNKAEEIKKELSEVDNKLKRLRDDVVDNSLSLFSTLSSFLSSDSYSELEQESLTLNNQLNNIRDRTSELKKDKKETIRQIEKETSLKQKLKDDFKNLKGFDIPDDIPNKPNIDESTYDLKSENVSSWKDEDVYAPFVSKDVFEAFTEEEIKTLNLQSREWMYAQRLRFISEYYAPESIDKLIESFRIRFRDWSGVLNITINI